MSKHELLFNEAMQKTELKEQAASANFRKFTALNSTNCFYANIPLLDTVALTQAIFNNATLDNDIRVIVERTYTKLGRSNNSQSVEKIIKRPTSQEPVATEKKLSKSDAEDYNYSNFPKDLVRLLRGLHLENLPNFNYSEIFIKKLIVFYDKLDNKGTMVELFDAGATMGFNKDETIELSEKLKAMGLLGFVEKGYEKRTARIRY